MNQNLEIPLEYFIKENSIQAITSDSHKILNCIKQSNNCALDEEKKVVIPRIQELKNHILIKNID